MRLLPGFLVSIAYRLRQWSGRVLGISSYRQSTGSSAGKTASQPRDRDLVKFYGTLPVPYASTRVNANTLAAIPMVAQQRGPDGTWRNVSPTHPLQRLLDQPNPFSDPYRERVRMWSFLTLTGDAFLWLVDGAQGRQPKALITLSSQYMSLEPTPDGFAVQRYLYNPPGQQQPKALSPDEVLHIRDFNPAAESTGMGQLGVSPLDAGLRASLLEEAALDFNLDFFEEGASLGGFFKTKQPLGPDQAGELLDRFYSEHTQNRARGSSGRFHGWHVLSHGLEAQELKSNQTDMGWTNLRTHNREDQGMVMATPPALLGLLDTSHYNNAEQQEEYWTKYQILPRTRQANSAFTTFLARRWGENFRIIMDVAGLTALQEPLINIVQAGQVMQNSGALTPDEYRRWVAERRFPADEPVPDPHGSTYYIQLGMVPAQFQAEAGGTEASAPEGAERNGNGDHLQRALENLEAQARGALSDEQQRAAQWSRYVASQTRWERAFSSWFRVMFNQQRGEVLTELDKNGVERDGANLTEAITVQQGEAVKQYRLMLEASVGWHGQATVESLKAGQTFQLLTPDVQQWIESTAGDLIQRVDTNTKRAVGQQVAQSIEAGESIAKLRERIRGSFRQATALRAETIARTEVTSSIGYATDQGYTQTNRVLGRGWLSSRDDRVRTTHLQAERDNEFVRMGEPFMVGGYPARFPGDPQLPPEERINCRCTMFPVIKDPGGRSVPIYAMAYEPREAVHLSSGVTVAQLLPQVVPS